MVLDKTLSKRVSYKEMLMNRSDSENESDRKDDVFLNDDEISIHEDDVQICLDGKYYGKHLLRIIGDVVGQVIKVDYNTTLAKRGALQGLWFLWT
ncbi:hypothetical protein Goarm_004856 [Gossypium armourianum]|uniref:Uncharacterized protein n=1 Tax=Gossypium armourianum TaxID=34283 RepID=A0A7J9JY31_9ROSI|nr:hypothetical protein [Gossypium armourianum]